MAELQYNEVGILAVLKSILFHSVLFMYLKVFGVLRTYFLPTYPSLTENKIPGNIVLITLKPKSTFFAIKIFESIVDVLFNKVFLKVKEIVLVSFFKLLDSSII